MTDGYLVYYMDGEVRLYKDFFYLDEAIEFALGFDYGFLGIEFIKNGKVVNYIKNKEELYQSKGR